MVNEPHAAGNSNEINLTIPMLPNMEITATQTAEAVARFMEFEPDQIDAVKMALIEACINAFEYSNSVEGQVYIKFIMNSEDLVVVIRDFGEGFDPERSGAGTKKYRGHGLKIMKGLMDKVEIVSGAGGTTITMSKTRASK